MGCLVAGLAIFLGVHSVRIVADDWRTARVASPGPNAWSGLYAVLTLPFFFLLAAWAAFALYLHGVLIGVRPIGEPNSPRRGK